MDHIYLDNAFRWFHWNADRIDRISTIVVILFSAILLWLISFRWWSRVASHFVADLLVIRRNAGIASGIPISRDFTEELKRACKIYASPRLSDEHQWQQVTFEFPFLEDAPQTLVDKTVLVLCAEALGSELEWMFRNTQGRAREELVLKVGNAIRRPPITPAVPDAVQKQKAKLPPEADADPVN